MSAETFNPEIKSLNAAPKKKQEKIDVQKMYAMKNTVKEKIFDDGSGEVTVIFLSIWIFIQIDMENRRIPKSGISQAFVRTALLGR